MEFAFLKLNDGQFALGRGPFAAHAHPPQGESAFYQNDFTLSDSRPWKVPAAFDLVADPRSLLDLDHASDPPEILWEPLDDVEFRAVFTKIQHALRDGSGLEKAVPVITERGVLESGSPFAWMEYLLDGLSAKLWPYGFCLGNRGVLGATPERFLHVHDGHIETMALAGTARPGQDHAFESDSKQIREHEYVVRHLVESLADLGDLRQAPRRILHLDGIVHFLTSVSVQSKAPPDLNLLLRNLHPTPAVGVFPTTTQHLRRLDEWRLRLRTPSEFGAPFGLWHEGTFHSVVSIRHVSWVGRQLAIPSGCGVIAASQVEKEWQELSLKRSVVKTMIGMNAQTSWTTHRECDEHLRPTCR